MLIDFSRMHGALDNDFRVADNLRYGLNGAGKKMLIEFSRMHGALDNDFRVADNLRYGLNGAGKRDVD